jgi:hypothetical protein
MELGILNSLEAAALKLLTVILSRSLISISGLGASLEASISAAPWFEK